MFGCVDLVADAFLISALPQSHVPVVAKFHYDPARCHALLQEAGWVLRADSVRAKDCKPLKLSL